MTPKTLSKERYEKFLEILETYYQDNPPSLDATEFNQGIAKKLVEASISRSEVCGIEAAMFADRPVTEEDLGDKIIRAACNEFESALGFGSLPWDSTTDWTQLRKFVVKVYQSDPQEFRKFEEWRKGDGKYQGCTNKSISQNPHIFIHTHHPTFKASAMHKTDEQRGEYTTDENGLPENY